MSTVVLITGTSSGIGLAVAEYLGKRGYMVYGGSRSGKENRYFKAIPLDVTDRTQVQEVVKSIIQQEGRIDVLLNNAGVGLAGPLEWYREDDMEKLFKTNIHGVVNTCQAVLPSMRERQTGKIINISSIGSVMGLPFRGLYSASKAAVDMLTEALRYEVRKQGIQVCALHPGDVRTAINDHRLGSRPEQATVYDEIFERSQKTMNDHVDRGVDPASFGPFIEKIIKSARMKPHYYLGHFSQKLSVRLKRLLPDSWFEMIIRKYYEV